MSLHDLAGRRVGVLGLGTETIEAIPVLRRHGVAVVGAFVDEPAGVADDLLAELVRLEVPVDATAAAPVEGVDLWVRSPGFPRYRSDVAPLWADTRMTTAIGLWLEIYGPGRHTTFVTGTKGKSTTCQFIDLLLGDRDHLVIGNMGVPAWSVPDEVAEASSPLVCELSSYQLSDMAFVPDLGVVTSLGADHVSWHGSLERYHHDKLQVLRAGAVSGRTAVLGTADGGLVDALLAEIGGEPVTADETSAAAAIGRLPVHIAADLTLAARAVERITGEAVGSEAIERTCDAYTPLQGRLSDAGQIRGMAAIDDSLGSNPLATGAALRSLRGALAYVLLGGDDRGVSLDPVLQALRERPPASTVLVALPDTGPAVVEALADLPAVRRTEIAASVPDAVSRVRADTWAADVVLFSPCAPTPPDQGTWKTRSAAFRRAIGASAGEDG